MLMRADDPKDYVDSVRAAVAANIAAYRALGLSEEQRAAFEPGYVQQLLMALDAYFTHRGRGQEGKDGNPLNEVRMITDSLQGTQMGAAFAAAGTVAEIGPAMALPKDATVVNGEVIDQR